MDLKTRTVVLEYALHLENHVNDLVIAFLNITSEQRKALTNKSGGLSFKNKIDLLFDIQVLDKSEYQLLLLLMEYRNQFMHNFECNTFSDAFRFLGSDKQRDLRKHLPEDLDDSDNESWKNAFSNLFMEINAVLVKKFNRITETENENMQAIDNLAEVIKCFATFYYKIWKGILPDLQKSASSVSGDTVAELQVLVDEVHDDLGMKIIKDFDVDMFDKIVKRIGKAYY